MFSSNNTHSIFQYQELITTFLLFWGERQYLLSYEKISQKKIRLNLRTLCQYCRKESTKVIAGSRTHSGRGDWASSHFTLVCREFARLIKIMLFPSTLKQLLPTVNPRGRCAGVSWKSSHLPATDPQSWTISVNTIPLWPVPAWRSFTHLPLILSASGTGGHCSAILTTDPDPSSEHCKIPQLLVALDNSF